MPDNWCKTFPEAIHCLKHNITEQPLCYCGEPLNFYRLNQGYNKNCSLLCSNRNRKDRNPTPDMDSFIKNSKKLNPNYGYDKVTEADLANKKVTIICPVHGEFTQSIYSHLSGNRCSRCTGGVKQTKDEFIEKAKAIRPEYDYSKVEYKNSQTPVVVICPKHGEFYPKPGNILNNNTKCPRCSNNTSKPEQEIVQFIKQHYQGEILTSDRKILNGKELDVYLPQLNFAIEFNGIMWHSFGKNSSERFNNLDRLKENKLNHLKKTEQCSKKGIQLFHIFENEWLNQKEKWEDLILDKLGCNKKIGARKCFIREIDSKTQREFEKRNHLQNDGLSKIRIGLFYKKDEYAHTKMVALMTFSKSRMSKNYEYELVRFCSVSGYTIQGGASKLLKYFERKYEPKSLVSYANRRWSTGNLYYKLGFELSHISAPNYFYFGKDRVLYSRNKFQKHKLKSILEHYSEELTEYQNMLELNNYRIIYDSGNYVFFKDYK